jgi:hypothetical protein
VCKIVGSSSLDSRITLHTSLLCILFEALLVLVRRDVSHLTRVFFLLGFLSVIARPTLPGWPPSTTLALCTSGPPDPLHLVALPGKWGPPLRYARLPRPYTHAMASVDGHGMRLAGKFKFYGLGEDGKWLFLTSYCFPPCLTVSLLPC